jgi:hypothetical protein
MRKPEIIIYKGKNVVYLDFSGMKDKNEIMQLETDGADYIKKQTANSVYTLTNMEGMFFNNELKSFFEQTARGNAKFVKAGAVIGMTGLISIMYNAFVTFTGRAIKSCKNKEEALEYLSSL